MSSRELAGGEGGAVVERVKGELRRTWRMGEAEEEVVEEV